MRRVLLVLTMIVLGLAIYSAWNIFGPTLSAPEEKYFYIRTGESYSEVLASLSEKKIIGNQFFFRIVARQLKYQQVKPGRYAINNGGNIFSLVRMLKSGGQSPVKFIINKLRTKEDLAAYIGNNFECDSSAVIRFFSSNDSLRSSGYDSNTVMTVVIPDTYLMNWNGSVRKIFNRLTDDHDNFWTRERVNKAAKLSFSPVQVYILASIVEEESNIPEDKKLIASVYINRLQKNMKLQADPTVKFALRDFNLKRILFGHLKYNSPYNTYQVSGLPPGPICTPSKKTIDAVLDSPATDYIFFAASPELNGRHNFAATYEQHKIFAKQYQAALDSLVISRSK